MKNFLLIFFFSVFYIVSGQGTWMDVPFTETENSCEDGNTFTEIFISEVYDSNGGTYGVIELYNPTDQIINLSLYRIRRKTTYGEGNWGQPTDAWQGEIGFPLAGSIPPSTTFLIIIPGNNNNCMEAGSYPSHLKQTLTFTHGINERDQIQLLKNGNVIDDFQAPNIPPYTGGSGNVNVTNNGGYTVRRKPDAETPKSVQDWNDWDVVVIDSQDCSNLGSHTIDNPTPPEVEFVQRHRDDPGTSPYTFCRTPARIRVRLTNPSYIPQNYIVSLAGVNSGTTYYNNTNQTHTSGINALLFTAANLPEDTYIVTITDKSTGCMIKIQFEIDEKRAIISPIEPIS